jgi:hypothetical protein
MNKVSKNLIKRNRLSKKKLNAGAPGTRNPKVIEDDDPVCPAIYPQCCRAWPESARCIPRNRSCGKFYSTYVESSTDKPYTKRVITRERDVPHGDVCPAGISTKPAPKPTRKPRERVEEEEEEEKPKRTRKPRERVEEEEEEEKPKRTRKPRGKPCDDQGWCSVQGGFNLY